MRLGLGTGLRWGELTRAKASDLTGPVLTVAQTKSGRVRRVPVPSELAAEIRSHVGLLVPQTNYWHTVQRIRRLSGVSRFHPHQLRHTYACAWLEKGGSLAALQQMLGHASIVTTQRYAKLTDEAVQREVARVHREQAGNAAG
jgi:integrase